MDRIRQRQLQRIKEQNHQQCSTSNCCNTTPNSQEIGNYLSQITTNQNIEMIGENRITYYPPVFV